MSYIILCRNKGALIPIVTGDDDGAIAEYETEHEADMAAMGTMLCRAVGYEVVEVIV